MHRTVVSTFFLIFFLGFITAPTIISMIDDTVDVSVFFASSEEEEKGQEKNKDIEIFITEFNCDDINFGSFKTKNRKGYYYKKYPKPHLNLISPPPEIYIL